MRITVTTCAKLNLTLDVVGRREDGYHLLETAMHSVDLADTVTLTPSDSAGLRVTCSLGALSDSEENLALQAARRYFARAGREEPRLLIRVEKQIPLCAGLGGGSSDAAAVLLALNRMFGCFSPDELAAIGLSLGADVPFCLRGGAMLARGTGGELTPLPALTRGAFVLAKPEEKRSTGEMYRNLDALGAPPRADSERAAAALRAGSLDALGASFGNAFDALWTGGPTQAARARMRECGALGVSLSGSGPTVFGLFRTAPEAERCAALLREQTPNVWVCRPASRGCALRESE